MSNPSSALWTAGMAAAMGAVAAITLAGCGTAITKPSQSATPAGSPVTPSPSAPASNSAVPGPPDGSVLLSTQTSGGATYTRYRTSLEPSNVIAYYDGSFRAAGFTVTSTNGGGGGWGQYGGSGADTEANNGSTFAAINAGGATGGQVFFETCVGPSAAVVAACRNENQSTSGGS